MLTALSIGHGGLGRFGNQLFTIAGVIGIATKSNQPYGFPRWRNVDNALFGQSVDEMSEHFVNPLPVIPDDIHFREYGYFWDFRDIYLPEGNWTIDAHLQDPRYFEHCMPLIRETFRMKDEPPQNEFVAIHWRAGDYVDDPAAYHPRCDRDYYERAVMQFPEGTKFILFSDDLQSAREKFDAISLDWNNAVVDSTYLQDFALMKRCKSFICANSSFSYMAALLGEHPDKKMILPRRWFGSSANISFDGYHQTAVVL